MVAVWPLALAALAAVSLASQPSGQQSFPLRRVSQRENHPDPAVRAAFARDEALFHRIRFASRLGPDERALLERDVARIAVRRRDMQTTPLLDYNFDMGYAVSISVGTPAQTFDVVADTGSHDLVLYDIQCAAQCNGRPVFDHTKSSTFVNLQQDVYQAYGTGDAKGVFVTDRVVMGGYYVQAHPIALITSSTIVQYMGAGISGIMGFGWPSVDSTQTGDTFKSPTPMWQALAMSSWTDKQFGMWLGRANVDSAHISNDALEGSAPGLGDLSLGTVTGLVAVSLAGGGNASSRGASTHTRSGLNTSLYTGQVTYYDANAQQWWQIALYSYSLNGKEVVLGSGVGVAAVIDSGSTGIMMPQAYAAAFYAAIPGSIAVTDASGTPNGQWAVPCNTKTSISFKFGGANQPAWSMSTVDLLRSYVSSQPSMCFGSVQVGDWLLGAAFMKNVYTAFRYQPTPQVGFATLAPAYNYQSSNGGGSGGKSGGSSGGGSGRGNGAKNHAARRYALPTFSALVAMAMLPLLGAA